MCPTPLRIVSRSVCLGLAMLVSALGVFSISDMPIRYDLRLPCSDCNVGMPGICSADSVEPGVLWTLPRPGPCVSR